MKQAAILIQRNMPNPLPYKALKTVTLVRRQSVTPVR